MVIETCMVGTSDSAFLQQAAHITEGLYLRPRRTSALLQYLLVSISHFVFIHCLPVCGVDAFVGHQTSWLQIHVVWVCDVSAFSGSESVGG